MSDDVSSELPEQPTRKTRFDCCLSFCRLLNIATGLSALLCLVAHAMALVAGPEFSKVGVLGAP